MFCKSCMSVCHLFLFQTHSWGLKRTPPSPAAATSGRDKVPGNTHVAEISIITITCSSCSTCRHWQTLLKTGDNRQRQENVTKYMSPCACDTPECSFLGCSLRVLWLLTGKTGSFVLCGPGKGQGPSGMRVGIAAHLLSTPPTSCPSCAPRVWLGAPHAQVWPNTLLKAALSTRGFFFRTSWKTSAWRDWTVS